MTENDNLPFQDETLKPETRPTGRPTKYDPNKNEQVTNLCLLGVTDDELADFLEISTSTLYEWKQRYPEFSEAVLSGKSVADGLVARSLFNSAKSGIDTSAAKFWLNNRRPQNWRDKTETTVKVQTEQVFKIGDTEVRF